MESVKEILAEQERTRQECAQLDMLVSKYKKKMPEDIGAHWDTSQASIAFNDIDEGCRSSGLNIYSCQMEEFWAGLYDPSVYEAKTLWNRRKHNCHKIAKVIDAWSQRKALSSIYLVKHGTLNKGLVADGNHRLTVSRAICAESVPFMVEATNATWVSHAFPSAICIYKA